MKLAASLTIVALLSGCTTVSTGEFTTSVNTVATPSKFRTIVDGRYRKSEQAAMVDCVNDAMASPSENILLPHVRQTKRADGYRVDLVVAASQFLVAYIRDDGRFQLDTSDYSGVVKFNREETSIKACLSKHREG